MTFKQHFYRTLLEAKMECPEATQDLSLNTKNRNATRDNHAYGPLNPAQPSEEYWESLAKKWKSSVEEAKASRCANCVAFDISPRMKECMPVVDEKLHWSYYSMPGFDADPEFGYCWMHHFKCFNARSCDTWASGGPIKDDETSYQWQEKNSNVVSEAKKKKADRCKRKADSVYGKKTSAYKSGAIVRCRKGKIWKKK